MRFSHLAGHTLRQPPADAHLSSHQLLVRAGYVRSLEGGQFAYLPLGVLARQRLQAIARRELAAAGAQEIALPAGPAAGEAAADLARREIDSYRQLPAILFEIKPRPGVTPGRGTRAGLFGAGERLVVDMYALGGVQPEPSPYALAAAGQAVEAAIERVLAACEVPAVWAGAGEGVRGLYLRQAGGDETVVSCPNCDYAAERSHAAMAWAAPPAAVPTVGGPEPAVEEIETPDCNTIAALAAFLGVPAAQTLKMVFYSVAGRVTCLVIRGDRVVDEDKLARLLGTRQYYASLEDELEAVGAVGGYASPIGLDAERVRVVADLSVRAGRSWITGANRPGYHLRNVTLPRDLDPPEWADLAQVEPGDGCPRCAQPLTVDDAFALGYSGPPRPAEGEFLDEAGVPQPLRLASWQLDLGRLLPAIAEHHHDEYGLIWPAACAPLDVHLVALDLRYEQAGQTVAGRAEELYVRLRAMGLAVLYDDREASPGVKFADADLIGLPLRLTIGKRAMQSQTIEARWRGQAERLTLDEEGLIAAVEILRAHKL